MINLLRWCLGIMIAAGVVLFALGNRETVSIVWSPFHPAATLSIAVIVLCALGAGFVLGAFNLWLDNLALIGKQRRQNRQIRRLEKTLNAQQKTQTAPQTTLLPDHRP